MPILVLVPMVLGAAIGLFARYSSPGREWTGLYLAPSLGAAAAGIVWTIGILAGATGDNLWLWLACLAVAALVSFTVPRVLPKRRARADAEYLAQLTQRA